MAFNDKLAEARKRRDITQEDLADRLNVKRQTVSKWERGDSMPEVWHLLELAKVLEVSLDDLFEEELQREPKQNPIPPGLKAGAEQLRDFFGEFEKKLYGKGDDRNE